MDVDRVLFLGDSHGNAPFVIQAIATAYKYGCQAVVQVGDFGIWDHRAEGVRFLDAVQEALEKADMILVFCDGNHENFDSLYARPVDEDGFRRVRDRIWHAPRGHIWTWNEVTFLAMGGAHSIDGPGGVWDQMRGPIYRFDPVDMEKSEIDLGGWWSQEMITEEEVSNAIENIVNFAGDIDIMIAHDAPLSVQIPGIRGYPMANTNRERLTQVVNIANPKLFVGGHYHRRHTDVYRDAKVEILAADVNGNEEQALAVDLERFRS